MRGGISDVEAYCQISMPLGVRMLCLRCNAEKPASSFVKDQSRPTGWYPYCKQCSDLYQKRMPSKTKGTLEWFRRVTWIGINGRTVNGKHPMPHHASSASYLKKGIKLGMTKEEFYSWCDENREVILALWAAGQRPSVDRVDSSGDYTIKNIRVLSLQENMRRKSHKTVTYKASCAMTGRTFIFKGHAELKNAGHIVPSVYRCLYGKKKTHHGLMWEKL